MTRRYSVIRQVTLPGSAEVCWPLLADPRLLSQWFAEADRIEALGAFRFDFGDGDFFSGIVSAIEEPIALELKWKFMDLGATSEIGFFLSPDGANTEVSVVDRGEYTAQGVSELREGWADFLGRLEKRVRTGENTRYRWTPEICMGALLRQESSAATQMITGAAWWRETFPGSDVTLEPGDSEHIVRATFTHPEWSNLPTHAVIRATARCKGLSLSVKHSGWTECPEDFQLQARSRLAGLWQAGLLKLEQLSSTPDNHAAANRRLRVGAAGKPRIWEALGS